MSNYNHSTLPDELILSILSFRPTHKIGNIIKNEYINSFNKKKYNNILQNNIKQILFGRNRANGFGLNYDFHIDIMDSHWVLTDITDNIQLQAINCKYCGNYILTSMNYNSLSTKIKCNGFCNNNYNNEINNIDWNRVTLEIDETDDEPEDDEIYFGILTETNIYDFY